MKRSVFVHTDTNGSWQTNDIPLCNTTQTQIVQLKHIGSFGDRYSTIRKFYRMRLKHSWNLRAVLCQSNFRVIVFFSFGEYFIVVNFHPYTVHIGNVDAFSFIIFLSYIIYYCCPIAKGTPGQRKIWKW